MRYVPDEYILTKVRLGKFKASMLRTLPWNYVRLRFNKLDTFGVINEDVLK